MGHSRWGLSRVEQRDRITNLLATLPLVQPRIGWLSGLQQHIGLDFWRVDFGLFRVLFALSLGNQPLKTEGPRKGWIYFKEEVLKT